MYGLWYLFIPVLVDIRFLLHCHSVLPEVSEAVHSHWLFMSSDVFPMMTKFHYMWGINFFSRFCSQMLNYSPISCFYLHYFEVSVNKGNPPFDPGVQRDAVSRVCTQGCGRKGSEQCSGSFPVVWKILFQHNCTVAIIRERESPQTSCQVSFQMPSLLYKSSYKATTYFMRQDQRDPGEGERLARTLSFFCRIGSCCCECISQWSIEFAISLGLDH